MSQNCKSRKAVGNTAALRLESRSLSFSLYQTANANSMQKLMADKASKHVLRFMLSLRRAADNKTGCSSFCRAPFKISLIFFCRRPAPGFCRFLRRCKSVKNPCLRRFRSGASRRIRIPARCRDMWRCRQEILRPSRSAVGIQG